MCKENNFLKKIPERTIQQKVEFLKSVHKLDLDATANAVIYDYFLYLMLFVGVEPTHCHRLKHLNILCNNYAKFI